MAEQTTGQNRFINVCDRLFHSRNTSYIEACETGRSQTSSSADIPILHQRRWLQWSRFDPQGSREILKRIKGPNIWPENSWLPSTNGGLKLGSNDCPIPWDDSIQVPCLKKEWSDSNKCYLAKLKQLGLQSRHLLWQPCTPKGYIKHLPQKFVTVIQFPPIPIWHKEEATLVPPHLTCTFFPPEATFFIHMRILLQPKVLVQSFAFEG